MAHDFSELADIQAIVASLLGKAAWGVALGYSTFITMEFGALVQERGHIHGEWHLWVYGADWRLEDRNRILAGSSDSRTRQAPAVKRMEGLVLQTVEITPPAFDTVFTFEGGVVLRLFATRSEDMDHWLLFVPDGNVLVLGPGTGWSFRSASEPR